MHKKMKKGRPYYYIREMARIDGKPTVVNQVYLGSPEKIMQMALQEPAILKKIQVREFGALWLADLIEREIDFTAIVDDVIPKGKNEKGPSVGQYFLYAVLNRMVDSCSKREFPQWFRETAISQIRPVEVDALTSQRYWEKWERVSQEQIGQIAEEFFQRLARLCPPDSGGFLSTPPIIIPIWPRRPIGIGGPGQKQGRQGLAKAGGRGPAVSQEFGAAPLLSGIRGTTT
jgi:hypothetical protein